MVYNEETHEEDGNYPDPEVEGIDEYEVEEDGD